MNKTKSKNKIGDTLTSTAHTHTLWRTQWWINILLREYTKVIEHCVFGDCVCLPTNEIKWLNQQKTSFEKKPHRHSRTGNDGEEMWLHSILKF